MSEPNEHSPAYKLFHYYFTCQIPAMFAHEKQHAMMGTPDYETAEMNEQAAKAMVTRQHTVVEMIKYHERGAQIILNDPKDAVKIYHMLREHLNAKREQVQFSVNNANVPLRDLKAMDEFAALMYRIARQYETKAPEEGRMSRRMDDMFAGRRMRRRQLEEKREEQARIAEGREPEERPIPEHTPITDDISSTALERGLPLRK